MITLAIFETEKRLVSTRKGAILVVRRKWAGAWETVALCVRVVLLVLIFAQVVVVSAFVDGQYELFTVLAGLTLGLVTWLSIVPWRIVLTKILARRVRWIAGPAGPGDVCRVTTHD